MKNIMKSQFLQLRKDKICYFLFFGIMIVSFIIAFLMTEPIPDDSRYTGGEEAIFGLSMFQLLAQFFLYIFTAQACGIDFMDKTCNYEILAGHTRREVFFGRAIPTIIISTIGTLLLIAAPISAEVFFLGGWGDKVSFTDVLARLLLMAFPITRVTCEFIFLTFIVKNPYVVMGASYLLFIILGMNIPVTPEHYFILGISNINAITQIDMWQSFNLSGKMFYIYETELSAELVIPTILVSVIVGGIALLLGYTFFKNDDMN